MQNYLSTYSFGFRLKCRVAQEKTSPGPVPADIPNRKPGVVSIAAQILNCRFGEDPRTYSAHARDGRTGGPRNVDTLDEAGPPA